jgi:hypothetical protein
VNDEIEALWKQHPEGTTTLVLDAREQPRMTTVLKRGDFTKPGDRVTTGVPAVLNPLPKNADSSRLTFAKWLVSPRVAHHGACDVNRVWQAYFGTGLVETAGGLRHARQPSRAIRAARLAGREFMEHGWSTSICTSSSSPARPTSSPASHAGAARTRSLQPPARSRPAIPRRRRGRARHPARRQRPAQSRRRRTRRHAARARLSL